MNRKEGKDNQKETIELMAYQFESRVRYSETGENQQLALVSLIDYFQDCSTFQSEELGCGLQYMNGHNRVWMILSWQIEILRRPVLGEKVTAKTWPYGFKAFFGYRNFVLLDENGEYLAKANSVWVLMDVNTGKPCLPEEGHISRYTQEPQLEMQTYSRKIKMPEDGVKMDPITVNRSHLDSNHHVNNGQYICMAEAYLPEGYQVAGMRVEYRRQAYLHDVIVPVVHEEKHEITVSLCGENGDAFAVIVFAGSR